MTESNTTDTPQPPEPSDPIGAALAQYNAGFRATLSGTPPTNWHDLDAWQRAEALGVDWRDLSIFFSRCDVRIFSRPALSTIEAVFRMRRWFALGKPDADADRVSFVGAESVRAVVVDVLRRLPPPVRHLAVEAISWREVGRDAHAYATGASVHKTLPGDSGHEIMLSGVRTDAELSEIVFHELGHAWHHVVSETTIDRSGRREDLADRIKQGREQREEWIERHVASEELADDMAALWGMPRSKRVSEALRRELFTLDYDEAAVARVRPVDALRGLDELATPAVPFENLDELDELGRRLEAAADEADADTLAGGSIDVGIAIAPPAPDDTPDATGPADDDYQRGREAARSSIRAIIRALRDPSPETLPREITQHGVRGLAADQSSQYAAGWAAVEGSYRDRLDRVRAYLSGDAEETDVELAELLERQDADGAIASETEQ